MKKIFLISLISCFSLQTYAFEDLVLTTDGKINNIKIENNSILDIQPLTTILNEKNTLFIIPKNIGETSFTLSKNEESFVFNIKIEKENTIINNIDGFEIVSLDTHPIILDCDIDMPPIIKKRETINIDGAEIELDSINEEVE